MTRNEYFEASALEDMALRCRAQVIRLATDGGCFIGASLSCVDLLVYLYEHFLRIDPDDMESLERDYFILSKGHDVPALYAVLAEIGVLDRKISAPSGADTKPAGVQRMVSREHVHGRPCKANREPQSLREGFSLGFHIGNFHCSAEH